MPEQERGLCLEGLGVRPVPLVFGIGGTFRAPDRGLNVEFEAPFEVTDGARDVTMSEGLDCTPGEVVGMDEGIDNHRDVSGGRFRLSRCRTVSPWQSPRTVQRHARFLK
jgi:hypothetical protein